MAAVIYWGLIETIIVAGIGYLEASKLRRMEGERQHACVCVSGEMCTFLPNISACVCCGYKQSRLFEIKIMATLGDDGMQL